MIQWALLGVNLVILACVFYTTSAVSQQLADAQGEIAEIKAIVQNACCKMGGSGSSKAESDKAAESKKAK